jgi:uncharacterized protein
LDKIWSVILRSLIAEAEQTAKEFKIVCVTGPRQSGKTTLCRQVFKNKPYVSLEDPDIAAQAMKDTRGFLNKYKNGAVLDEAQRVPQLFNYLQTIVDSKKSNGQFVLSGSNNFLMQDNISQTLAGRVGYIELLPLSLNEIKPGKASMALEERILQGFYPAVVTRQSTHKRWFPNYIKTYVERDVRMIRNIGNIILFNKFLKLCAGRAAQLLNINNLANEVGVDNKTIQAWLAVLEGSYIAYLLPPYHQNFSKRVIKSPKLYFYDTGLLCSLLNITSVEGLKKSPQYGALFENFILSELKKNRSNKEQFGSLFFFRDSSGNEVDVIIENEDGLKPIEIKSSKKTDPSQFKNLKWFQKVFRQDGGILIHAGEKESQFQNEISVLGWKQIAGL